MLDQAQLAEVMACLCHQGPRPRKSAGRLVR